MQDAETTREGSPARGCNLPGGPWPVLRHASSRGRFTLFAGLLASVLFVVHAPTAATITSLATFAGTNGANPYAELIQATNGNLYGTALNGGTYDSGTVFEVATNGLLISLLSLDGTNGAFPYAGLIQARDGDLYGTANIGGAYNFGSIFRITPAGAFTNLFAFAGTNGANPQAGLVQGNDGNFYGTTAYDTTAGNGTVFVMTPAGTLTNLLTFAGTNGANPQSGLALGSDRNIYGTTVNGGANGYAGGGSGYGTIFRITPAGALTTLYSFGTVTDALGVPVDGANPQSRLVQADDGNFYGTTVNGGKYNLGTVFEVTTNGILTNLLSFDGTNNGANPYAGLVEAADGNFYGVTYGTTALGGPGCGAVFGISRSGVLNLVAAFDCTNEAYPYAGLIQGSDGALYGTTSGGGSAAQQGVAFRIAEMPIFTIQPSNQTDSPGATAAFVASATGGFAPLSYQWLKDSLPLANGVGIFGATSNTLTIGNLTTADQGTYSVIVSNTFGDSLSSSNASLLVVIPNLAVNITSPAQDAQVSNALAVVTGTASDNVGVPTVYYQLNNGSGNTAVTTNGGTNWNASVTLAPGTNLFSAYCQDDSGNASPTNSLRLIYVPTAPLTVLVAGQGTVSPDLNGQYLALGSTYTLTAIPTNGYVFSNWTGSVFSSAAVLTFIMQSNLVLQANFVPGIFAPTKGTYNGLFKPLTGISPTNSGLFTLSMSSKGLFTAKARSGAGQASFIGQFLNGAAMTMGIPPGKDLATLALHLQLGGTIQGTEWVTGTLSDESSSAAVFAYLSGKSPQVPFRGRTSYTLAIPPGTNAASSPGGWGALTANLDDKGRFALAGTLGDGSKISQSTLITPGGDLPLFIPLNRGKGMLMGWLQFAGDAPQGNDLIWTKSASLPRQRYYPNGFTLKTSVSGSTYTRPVAANNALPLTNALFVLSGGNLPARLTNVLELVKNKAVLAANPDSLTLRLNPADGTFSGSFMPPGTQTKSALTGVVLQSMNMAVGVFLGKDQSGEVRLQSQ